MRDRKPRFGFFKYSCCAGCEFQTIFFQSKIFETLEQVEFIYCRMLTSSGTPVGPFDLALVEGAITEAWQAAELRRIRESSKLLYAVGSCAVNGGIPAMKSLQPGRVIEKRVYDDLSSIHSIRPHAIESYVKVDGHIRGCPPAERDLHEALTSALTGRRPTFPQYSVCVECKIKGNTCILITDNEPCMGPVTNAGCGALCPSSGRACYSCWGPMRQANAMALAKLFEQAGMSPDDIVRKFTQFGTDTVEFRKVVQHYEA